MSAAFKTEFIFRCNWRNPRTPTNLTRTRQHQIALETFRLQPAVIQNIMEPINQPQPLQPVTEILATALKDAVQLCRHSWLRYSHFCSIMLDTGYRPIYSCVIWIASWYRYKLFGYLQTSPVVYLIWLFGLFCDTFKSSLFPTQGKVIFHL